MSAHHQNIKIAVDAVVFGYQKSKLYVLLIQQKFGSQNDYWALPGGLVQEDEALIEAVKRELKEETNVSVNYLEQLYTFGDDISRDPRNRVISVAYFALVDPSKLTLIADTDAEKVSWVEIDKIPNLAFDHNEIIRLGIERLKNKVTYQPIGFDLLPTKFLFSQLENLYNTIIGKEIDRRNFRKKMMSFGFITETEEYATKKTGRPAKLYAFNTAEYKRLEKEGIHFEIKLV
ncbi:NUDIX hydrolase [Flavobacterium jejuense]|uniref:NUDIX hydrolase n=1 Tax=Flavobacterium jejuense TaxID=1544455 RepID=A0ABX0INS3_9FLAO|nr:NUDIX domain-containing protein [Flavobacterium jejuense]NHN25445.1 NUDIX hydrolase [Flavobacterium jejuense]